MCVQGCVHGIYVGVMLQGIYWAVSLYISMYSYCSCAWEYISGCKLGCVYISILVHIVLCLVCIVCTRVSALSVYEYICDSWVCT